jgi:DNA mismatch endonuclease (patch repair protein)
MVDFLSKAARSALMSRVRSRGNKSTELAVARMLRAAGITGWRRHRCIRIGRPQRGRLRGHGPAAFHLVVRPDFVFARTRVAVFVDGCFWHDCPKHRCRPENNAEFWRNKFEGNAMRDKVVTMALRRNGWAVVRLWEHDVKEKPARCVSRICKVLDG